MSAKINQRLIYQLLASVIILLALFLVPAPLLPPHHLAESVHRTFNLGWKLSYLLSVIGIQFVFYVSIGILAAIFVRPENSLKKRLRKIFLLPLLLIGLVILIRSYKLGHWPVLIHISTFVGIIACFIGVWLGLSILYKRWKFIFIAVPAVLGLTFWVLLGRSNAALTLSTEKCLQQLIDASAKIPQGEDKFGALLSAAFKQPKQTNEDATDCNRATILALGIALGDEEIAKFVGLDPQSKLIQEATLLRSGTTLRERSDWPRHFCVSASLVVLEHPLVSDAGGLIKEQLDALSGGSGFSFCDIAADRAGVRFAEAATLSEMDAHAMKNFLGQKIGSNSFLPAIADLPENLNTEQFRTRYGSVGSEAYQKVINDIETRLNSSVVLSPLYSGTQ